MRQWLCCGGAWLVLSGCGVGNRNPEILAINDQEVSQSWGVYFLEESLLFTPGQIFRIWVEAEDPDGDDLQMWFAWQPPGLEFDPDGRKGSWSVPENFEQKLVLSSLVVSDLSEPQGISTVEIAFQMKETP